MAPTTDRRGWRRWLHRTPVVTGLVVVVLAAAGASAWAVIAASGTTYRVATAGYGNVEQTLDLIGTVQPVDEASVDFQVAGKIATIDVSPGQSVTAGQVLASLDASSLQAAVSQDESTLSADHSTLTSDEQSESSDSSSSSSSSDASSSGLGSSSSDGSLASQMSGAQQKLVADQQKADTDRMQESNDLQTANSLCGGSSSSGSASGSSPSSGGSGSESSGSGSSSSGTGSQCSSALSQVLSDQEQEASDLNAVSVDETSLAQLLSKDESSLQSAGEGSSSNRSGFSGTATSGVATPATIDSDQAAIDAEQASLDQSQLALDEAQLTTPLTGVVAAVNLTVGQSVSAGSSSEDIVVQGPQSFEVSGEVPVTEVGDVAVGNTADVIPDGYSDALSGVVTAVDDTLASAFSSSSSSDDQITVTLPTGTQGLYNGSDAEVSIVTGEAHDVLSVPTSAVHALGKTYLVDVLKNGTSKPTTVTIGALGTALTEITSGLAAGANVVLADLSTPLPTSSSASTGRSIVSLLGGGGTFVRVPAGARGGGGFFGGAG